MALTITITDPRTIAAIRAKAAERGISESEMVSALVDDAVAANPVEAMPDAPPETPEERAARFAEIDSLLKEIHATITDEDRAFDHNAWLYDENGLPH